MSKTWGPCRLPVWTMRTMENFMYYSNLTAMRQPCCTSGWMSHRVFCSYQPNYHNFQAKMFYFWHVMLFFFVFFNSWNITESFLGGTECSGPFQRWHFCLVFGSQGRSLEKPGPLFSSRRRRGKAAFTLYVEGSGSGAGEQQHRSPLSCPMWAAACRLCVWTEVGVRRGLGRQQRGLAAVSVEPAGSCVSAAPSCRAEVHLWQMSKEPPPLPHSPPTPFTPSLPSWHVFLFCLRALRTQRPFKTGGDEYGAVVIKAARSSSSVSVFFLCSSGEIQPWRNCWCESSTLPGGRLVLSSQLLLNSLFTAYSHWPLY